MNEMITDTRTPIEIALDIDSEGMTTARNLYEFLELDPKNYSRWCKVNITDNEFATEHEDFEVFVIKEENPLGGRPTTDYRLTTHFAKKLSLKGNDGRHTFASLMDDAGANEVCIKLIMGHSMKNNVTKGVYTHKTTQQLIDEVNKI